MEYHFTLLDAQVYVCALLPDCVSSECVSKNVLCMFMCVCVCVCVNEYGGGGQC